MIQSGQLVMQKFRSDFDIFEKQGTSLVTSVDLENEQFLQKELLKIVPDAGFIAEESGNSEKQSDFIWVIDPLDGTRNFVKGIPHFCIMVALMHKNDLIMAAIYQPTTHELYYAEKGKGLWLQGKQRIEFLDKNMQIQGAIAVCSDKQLKVLKLQMYNQGVYIAHRYFGSAGIDAIYVATGSVDFVMFEHVGWWDIAAGLLIIQEAGGLICQYTPSTEKPGYGTLKAGNQLFFHKNL